jgi:glycosyltransferase A (GT-A) superfamily protein (DUF2064 family)
LAKDLSRRAWSRRTGALLQIPRLDSRQLDADVHLFTSSPSARIPFQGAIVHAQRGRGFGERLSNAFDELSRQGYQQIVIVGRDCPELNAEDIHDAFAALDKGCAALGPDHRGGCYLIGLHASDAALLRDIDWQHDTDFHQLLARSGDDTVCLSIKIDLDSLEDLNRIASRSHSWKLLLQPLLGQLKQFILAVLSPSTRDCQRARWQLPPPSVLRLDVAC